MTTRAVVICDDCACAHDARVRNIERAFDPNENRVSRTAWSGSLTAYVVSRPHGQGTRMLSRPHGTCGVAASRGLRKDTTTPVALQLIWRVGPGASRGETDNCLDGTNSPNELWELLTVSQLVFSETTL
jgi:hypothetical protein